MSKTREELEELEATLQMAAGELMGAERGMVGPQFRNLKRYLMLAGGAMEGALSESAMIRRKLDQIEGKIRELTS